MPTENGGELTLHEAADLLDVHYMTVYRYVRLGVLDAHKSGKQWRVSRQAIEDFASEDASGQGEDAPWAERLESRMIVGDLNGAWSVVEAALAAGHAPFEVYAEYLAPALRSIGDRWEHGDLGVHEEHLASSVAGRLIGRLGPRFSRRGRPKGTVITAMPPGDDHALSCAMVADVVRSAGYSVLDLGGDTPVASLAATVDRVDDLAAVCISVVYDDALSGVSEMIALMRELAPNVPVYVGGRAIPTASDADALGADGWAGTLGDVIELVDGPIASPTGS